MEEINYSLIVVSAIAAIASPGPATLAIAGTSMNHGRRFGGYLAAGVLTGSLFWSTSPLLISQPYSIAMFGFLKFLDIVGHFIFYIWL